MDTPFNQQHQSLIDQFWTAQNAAPASKEAIAAFVAIIRHYYSEHERDFAWRRITTPYYVTVSEIMLQQTQTFRVAGKFEAFIAAFPDFATLAAAPTTEVIRLWKGLGYNRRALALQKIAQLVTTQHNGSLPTDAATLETFPCIGKATARSILTYAFNQPMPFIETNVRTVFIYFFFKGQANVTDAMLEPIVAAALDQSNPRTWNYALMDYGVMLKKTVGNISRLSAHYAKQSKFEGSDRQVRGMILQALLDQPGIPTHRLPEVLAKEPDRVEKIVADLQREGFIKAINGLLSLS
jgi:A/G-specific adenine glycosylase